MTAGHANQARYALVFSAAEDARAVNDAASRFGAGMDVEGSTLFTNDKFLFDYVVYHYVMKLRPSSRPEIIRPASEAPASKRPAP